MNHFAPISILKKEIDRLVVMAGFEKVVELRNREWLTAIYRKI